MGEADGEIVGIGANKERDFVRKRRLMGSDLHGNGAPLTGPIRHEIAGDGRVKAAEKIAVQCA